MPRIGIVEIVVMLIVLVMLIGIPVVIVIAVNASQKKKAAPPLTMAPPMGQAPMGQAPMGRAPYPVQTPYQPAPQQPAPQAAAPALDPQLVQHINDLLSQGRQGEAAQAYSQGTGASLSDAARAIETWPAGS